MHSVLCGGAANLPITSPNLTFQDFLSRLNKTSQIRNSERFLRKIEGNTICGTKKRRITSGQTSGENFVHDEPYRKPNSYSSFISDIMDACMKGDADSKAFLEELVPNLVTLLKAKKQRDNPDRCLNTTKDPVPLILTDLEWSEMSETIENIHDNIINDILGPVEQCNACENENDDNSDYSDVIDVDDGKDNNGDTCMVKHISNFR